MLTAAQLRNKYSDRQQRRPTPYSFNQRFCHDYHMVYTMYTHRIYQLIDTACFNGRDHVVVPNYTTCWSVDSTLAMSNVKTQTFFLGFWDPNG